MILTNPPFGGEEETRHPGQLPRGQADRRDGPAVPPTHHAEAAAPRRSRAGPAVVVPNGTLFGDGVCARIKEELLTKFNLHTIVRLPNGVFAPVHQHPDQPALLRPHRADRATSGTTSSRCPKAGRTTPRPRRSSSRSSPTAWRGGASARRTSGPGRCRPPKIAGQQLQPRPQEPERQGRLRAPAARSNWPTTSSRRNSASRRSCGRSRSCWGGSREQVADGALAEDWKADCSPNYGGSWQGLSHHWREVVGRKGL